MSLLLQSEIRKAVLLSGLEVRSAVKTSAFYEKPMPAIVPLQVAQVSFGNAQNSLGHPGIESTIVALT